MISLKGLLTEASALTNDFIQKIMQWENSVKAGWNKNTQRWFPHKSPEGGNPTIAYGHKLTNQDKEVEELMMNAQKEIDAKAFPQVPTTRPYSEKKGGRTRRRRASRAKRAIKRSYKRSNKRMQRTKRR